MDKGLKVSILLNRRVLVTRDSAHELEAALSAEADGGDASSLCFDFANVDAFTPSFVDEMLLICERVLQAVRMDGPVIFLNPPTSLSSKFVAIARAHGRTIEVGQDGSWVWSKASAVASAPAKSPAHG